MLHKPRAFVDMDGVIVNFDGYLQMRRDAAAASGQPFGGSDQLKREDGAYAEMMPTPGGLEGVRSLIGMGFDVWIATKPPTGVAFAYRDKAQWIFNWLPELKRKLIITHDKGMLGDALDVLIDDRPWRANCYDFQGTLIAHTEWQHTLDRCRQRIEGVNTVADCVRREYMRTLRASAPLYAGSEAVVDWSRIRGLRSRYVANGGFAAELPRFPGEEGSPAR